MHKVMKKCPVCSGELMIKRVGCPACQTEISGNFAMSGENLGLEEELFEFLKVFIFAEGSIKQSEKLLNCSYPKIKNLLKKTKVALGLQERGEKEEVGVIDRLDKGEIDLEEALKQLRTKKP